MPQPAFAVVKCTACKVGYEVAQQQAFGFPVQTVADTPEGQAVIFIGRFVQSRNGGQLLCFSCLPPQPHEEFAWKSIGSPYVTSDWPEAGT